MFAHKSGSNDQRLAVWFKSSEEQQSASTKEIFHLTHCCLNSFFHKNPGAFGKFSMLFSSCLSNCACLWHSMCHSLSSFLLASSKLPSSSNQLFVASDRCSAEANFLICFIGSRWQLDDAKDFNSSLKCHRTVLLSSWSHFLKNSITKLNVLLIFPIQTTHN